MPDPFGPAPTDKEVPPHVQSSALKQQTTFVKCATCQTTQDCQQLILMARKNWARRQCGSVPRTLFRPFLITDCCSLCSAILRAQPRPQDKCAKLLTNQLRDLSTLIDMSFAGNSCNLGDMETKHAASLNIPTQFFANGKFIISFLGRRGRLQLGKPL